MGIPSLFRDWIKKHPVRKNAVNNRLDMNVSSLSIDMNALIHLAFSIAYGYGDYENEEVYTFMKTLTPTLRDQKVFEILGQILIELLKKIRPTDTLILAVDGVAPMAKIQQQKQRRYMSALDARATDIHDSNSITPGTSFMLKLDKFLSVFIADNFDSKNSVRTVIYSGHLVPGEGEHKIFDYFRHGKVEVLNETGIHVIYGMDADFIILSLASDIENLFLARDSVVLEVNNPLGEKAVKINNFTSNDNIDISKLREIIDTETKILGSYKDFTVFAPLVGNDFLPKIPTLSNMTTAMTALFDAYKSGNSRLLDDENNILWDKFLTFLHALNLYPGNSENDRLQAINMEIINPDKRYPRTESRMISAARNEDGSVDYQMFRSAWYSNALTVKDRKIFDLFIQATLADSPGLNMLEYYGVNLEDVNNMSLQYLKGISWVVSYYIRGSHSVTWLWYYPYRYSPLTTDLKTTLENVDLRYLGAKPVNGEIRMGPIQQMVSVLPPKSFGQIPKTYRVLYEKNSPISDLMPRGFTVESDGITRDFQAIAHVPFADYGRIMKAVSDIHTSVTFKNWSNMEDDSTALRYINPLSPFMLHVDKIYIKRELHMQKARRLMNSERYPYVEQGQMLPYHDEFPWKNQEIEWSDLEMLL